MVQLTAIAQKMTRGFRVTFQFSESCPYLMAVAINCVGITPGSRVINHSTNTIVAHTDLPYELLEQLRPLTSIWGCPFKIEFFDSMAVAVAHFDVETTELARHMYGRSLLPAQVSYVM